MSVISAGGALIKKAEEAIREERAVRADKHHIDMHGRDISLLISSSCAPSSRVPLERIVSKVLITAGNAIQALGHLEYEEEDKREFKHTHRIIRSSPLKAIQDDVFGREVYRGIHSWEIAEEVSGALELIRGAYDKNKEIISSSLGSYTKLKEQEVASLLQTPLNLKKLRQIQTELNNLLYAMEVLSPSDDTGSVDVDYHEEPQDLITKRLEGLLKYVDLLLIAAEVEKFDLSSPLDVQRLFFLTNSFENRLYQWTAVSRDIQSNHAGADYTLHTDGLSFAQNLRGVCVGKFFSHFSIFSSLVERMKELTERKHRAVFSQNAGAPQEEMEALDSEAFDLDKLFGEAKMLMIRLSGHEPNTQEQLVSIARNIKRHLIDPLPRIKRELHDCFDLDSAEILIDLKLELLKVARDHKALKEQHAEIEGAAELSSLCAFLERASQNLVEIIDQKLSQVVDEEITEKTAKMTAFIEEEEKGSDWHDRMENFSDQLSAFRSHRFCSSLPEALKKRVDVEIGRIYWTCCFAIVEEYEAPETLQEMVDSLANNREIFQTYTLELAEIEEIDTELDGRIRASYFRRIDQLSQGIVNLLQQKIQSYGALAVGYCKMSPSKQLFREINDKYKEYKLVKEEADFLLQGIEKGKDALQRDLCQVGSLFCLLLLDFSFRSYARDPEDFFDNFLEKQKFFYKVEADVLAEDSPSPYQAPSRERLLALHALNRQGVESYVGIFTSSIMAFSDEIDSYSGWSEGESRGAFNYMRSKMEGVEEKFGKLIRGSKIASDNFKNLHLGMQNLKIQFQEVSLRQVPALLKSLEDAVMSDLAKTSKAEEFYREKIEKFYSECVFPKLFEEGRGSQTALYLLTQKGVILSKIHNIFEGRVAQSPDIRDLTSPLDRAGSIDLLSSQATPSSEALGIVSSPSPARPISSFPACL